MQTLLCSVKLPPFLPTHLISIHLHEIIMRLKKFWVRQKLRWFRGDKKKKCHCWIWSTLIFLFHEDAWLSASAFKLQKLACARLCPSLSLDFLSHLKEGDQHICFVACRPNSFKRGFIIFFCWGLQHVIHENKNTVSLCDTDDSPQRLARRTILSLPVDPLIYLLIKYH